MLPEIYDLEKIQVPLTRRDDYEEFWQETKLAARKQPLNMEKTDIEYPLSNIRVFDVTYRGFDDTPIHGWLILPRDSKQEPLPCLIHYHGFNGNRGRPWEFIHWVSLGIAVLSVDCRDQSGMTGNQAHYSSGYMTNVVCKGILDPYEYYFRAVYMDCLKAIDLACELSMIDPDRIILEGGSQGGALSIAVAGLDHRPWLAMADVPSNSDLRQRVDGEHGSFASIADYLRRYPDHADQAFVTLSYFDTINLADKISCPVYTSVALKDPVCPAACFYATYNRITSEKEIVVYPYNGHEGGGSLHTERKLAYLSRKLGEK